MKRFLAYLLAFSVIAFAAIAQENSGQGALVRLIQSKLSDAGRDVRIEGFSGGLSSRATLDRLTIADADGIWLELESAELNWSRTALLRGELRIEDLAAGALRILRRPLPNPNAPPTPEAQPFALPDLPVAIHIARFEIESLALGASVIGEPLTARIDAKASLDAGGGSINLAAARTDGRIALIDLSATYQPENRALAIDAAIREDAGGMIARSLDLPGRPSIALILAGSGPLEAFRADIALQTDGADRLAGYVLTETLGQGQRLTLDVSGDLSPLFLPEYQEFLGNRISLFARASRFDTGATELEQFSLSARSLSLQGSAVISPDGWPDRLSAQGTLRNPDGGSVLLPPVLGGMEVDEGTLAFAFDKSRGETWRGTTTLRGLRGSFGQSAILRAAGSGAFRQAERAVQAELSVSALGFELSDPSVDEIVGPSPAFEFVLQRSGGGPFVLSDMVAQMRVGGLTGKATVPADLFSDPILLEVDARIPDLSAVSSIANRTLGGAAAAKVSGSLNPFSGAFALAFEATTDALSLGSPELSSLLKGRTILNARIQRDETGTRIEGLRLTNPALSLQADLALQTGAVSGTAAVRLENLANVVPELPGPASVRIRIDPAGAGHEIEATATGPAGTQIAIGGQGSRNLDTFDLDMSATAPLSLANPFLQPGSLQGLAQGRFRLFGPPTLANVSGTVDISSGALAWPGAPASLREIGGTVGLDEARARVDVEARSSLGGRLDVGGTLDLSDRTQVDLELRFSDLAISQPDLFATTLSGVANYVGELGGAARLGGDITLGSTEIRVPSGGAPDSALIPGLRHVAEPPSVRRTRTFAGLIAQNTPTNSGSSEQTTLDLGLIAPNRITIRGRGVEAELGGAMRVGGTLASPQPQGRFILVRGRIDILGKRLTLDEGFVQARGSGAPEVSLLASSRSNDVTLQIGLVGPIDALDTSLTAVPELPGDEALARFLFGRGLGSLSALQAAQLASAVITLRGGGDGILGWLREATGLDDLDLSGSEDGGATLRAGKYLSENVYGDVALDSSGRSAVTLNLDLTPDITLRGTAKSDGGNGVGLFFERDY